MVHNRDMNKEPKYTTPDQKIDTTRTLFYTVSYMILSTGFVERTDPIYSEQRLGEEIARLASGNGGMIVSINSHHS